MLNPILKREIKSLFRTPKFFMGAGIYVLLLTAGVNMLTLSIADSYYGLMSYEFSATYYLMLGFQILAIVLVVPAVCGGTISGERERQTLDLLLVTKMTPSAIIRGKIYSSLLIVALLIAAALPVYGIIFYFGGLDIVNFVINTFYSFVVAVFVAYLSIFASAKFKKTTTAMVFTYLLMFIYTVVFFVLVMLFVLLVGDNAEILGGIVSFLNPVANFMSLVDSQVGTDVSWELLEAFDLDFENSYVYIWHINLVTSGVIIWILHKLSVRAIDPLK